MKSEAKNLDNTDLVYVQIDNWFSHHSPDSDQLERYELIRKTAKVMANVMVKTIPPCADRTSALRKLRETVMAANAAIACNEFNRSEWPQI